MIIECNKTKPYDNFPTKSGVVFTATCDGVKGVFMSCGWVPDTSMWALNLETGVWIPQANFTYITLLPNAKVVCGD